MKIENNSHIVIILISATVKQILNLKFHLFTGNRNPESCLDKFVKSQQKNEVNLFQAGFCYLGPLLS